jgi:hypothetical protein
VCGDLGAEVLDVAIAFGEDLEGEAFHGGGLRVGAEVQ